MRSCNLIYMYLAHVYRSLDHEYSLLPESAHKLIHVDGLLRHDALQHVVQCDKCACPAHTCTAVDYHEVLLTVGVGLTHTLDEIETSSEGNKTRKKQGKCRTGFKSEVHTALKVPDGFQKGGA